MGFSGLHIGKSGMGAAQRAMETAAHNLANVNTDGFTRQRVELRTAYPRQALGRAGAIQVGTGVVAAAVARLRQELTDGVYREGRGQAASTQAQAELLARAEAALGTVDDGLPETVDAMWNAWEQLSRDPRDGTLRAQVLDAARDVARFFRRAAATLAATRSQAVAGMAATVDAVNEAAAKVAALNGRIRDVVGAGGAPNDLLDERDRLLDELGELAGATALLDADGGVRVLIGGMPVVDEIRTHALEVDATGTARWVDDGRSVAATGRLGAEATMAGGILPGYLDELDAAALALRDLVNAAHAAGFDLAGASGGAVFAGTAAADLDLDPALSTATLAASAGGAPADGNHALVMGALRDSAGPSGHPVAADLRALAGRIGAAAVRSDLQAQVDAATLADIEEQRLADHGVSIDEEMTDMLRFQRAYEASARVITVMDEMLDRLINGTGVTR